MMSSQSNRQVVERWLRGDDDLLDFMVGGLLLARGVKRAVLFVKKGGQNENG